MSNINGMRHIDIHDPRVYAKKRVLLIGAGTIGSHLAHTLARMQVPLIIADHDTVEGHNIATQTYGAADVGKTKVRAVEEQIRAIDPRSSIQSFPHEFPDPKMKPGRYDIIVSAVDSLAARKKIATELIAKKITKPIIDGRVGREQVEVYYFPTAKQWLAQLPPSGDIDPCGARFTAYSANIAAGLMASQVKRLLMSQTMSVWRTIFDAASMVFIIERI